MVILIFDKTKILRFRLPNNVEDNFLCTFKPEGNINNVSFNIINKDGGWFAQNSYSVNFLNPINKEIISDVHLDLYNNYCIHICQNNKYMFMTVALFEEVDTNIFLIDNTTEITIANNNAMINYTDPLFNSQIIIKKEEDCWSIIEQNKSVIGCYLNNNILTKRSLYIGDIIRFMSLKIIWMGKFIVINNPNNLVKITKLVKLSSVTRQNNNDYKNEKEEEKIENIFSENDYFFHKPRLKTIIEDEKIVIDSPPQNQESRSLPFILNIGSRLTMLVFSFTSIYSAINTYKSTNNINSCVVPVISAISSLIASFVFPIIISKYEKKLSQKKEQLRQKKYSDYLNDKSQKINLIIQRQSQIVTENNPSVKDCQNIIMNKSNNLWLREKNDDDFLSVRLGLGKISAHIEIEAPEEHFELYDDNLFKKACDIAKNSKDLNNVPVSFSFVKNNISAVIMDKNTNANYIDSLIVQILANHCSLDLKIVILTNNNRFSYIKNIPHCWNDDYKECYYATNIDEMKRVCSYIEPEYKIRKEKEKEDDKETAEEDDDQNKKTKKWLKYSPYYLIITDDLKKCRTIKFVNELLENKSNYGFSFIMISNELKTITNDIGKFIFLSNNAGCILSKELAGTKQLNFIPDAIPQLQLDSIGEKLLNIPIEINKGLNVLPTTISFLDMLKVGRIEQINVFQKWSNSNPMVNLSAPIGVYPSGDDFMLDLHEKAHGPHGLIAGTTGSGKSEFIITYILSMALFYHPYEVQFVLIDYKGGGLSGAFENTDDNIRLPHLVGTISNLDKSEINRTLVSIESELKRRQRKFNEAKDLLGESTIDIYKYQKFYREGVLKEPIAHLFIISDEFAELKKQQPEFMDKLISTARIGRSLGVHLILATQKPSGVVNDQIWSNSKFRVCLKVQNRSDSIEVLKRDDAANLRDVGRFYLQVGNDELFELGQSAWAGARYLPSDTVKRKINDSIDFVDNTGMVIKSLNNVNKNEDQNDYGDQLTNIVKYIINTSAKHNIHTKKMWLDSIPREVYYNNLIKKYNYSIKQKEMNIIIGEYDNPAEQEQGLAVINLYDNENIVLYGMAGSGKENLITTLITSSIINYSPEKINYYILDFGSEALCCFEKTPHVGEVIVNGDIEKLEKLLEFLTKEIEKRKIIFKEYMGSYSNYIYNNNKMIPLIFVIINNYEVFTENYDKISEKMISLFRDGIKYGIKFLITSTIASKIGSRLSQFFSFKIMLQVDDESDYRYIMGCDRELKPLNTFGRGIINVNENAYEFQTAFISEIPKISSTIKLINKSLTEKYSVGAYKLKILPQKVYFNNVEYNNITLSKFPIGLDKNEVKPLYLDFEKNRIFPIIANYIEENMSFVQCLIYHMSLLPNTKIRVLDFMGIFSSINDDISIYTKDFDTVIQQIDIELDKDKTTSRKTVFVFLGIGLINNKISSNYNNFVDIVFNKINDCKNNSFILVDNYINYREIDLHSWSNNINKNNGIWLGDNISNQYSIKYKDNGISKENIFKEIGYCVVNGNVTIFKHIVNKENN